MDFLSNYDFLLPEELIATRPTAERTASRLMVLRKNDEKPVHDNFTNLRSYLKTGDVLVLNNTKVMRARINAYKKTGGRVQILLSRPLAEGYWTALINGKGPFLAGAQLLLDNDQSIVVVGKLHDEPGLYEITSTIDLNGYIKEHGELPLPPYFKRRAEKEDYERYQTVYAKTSGAVAAPTAGLHFTTEFLQELKLMGVRLVEITLHVGPGTFLPIRAKNIDDHKMHREFFSLGAVAAKELNLALAENRRIIPVGTTSMRVLEHVMALHQGQFFACEGSTSIFIRPGHRFLAASALITNFHLPRSTLILLVSAVAGRERLLLAYEEAIRKGYRFFSYGDACFLEICQ